jgi:hypothetical protein
VIGHSRNEGPWWHRREAIIPACSKTKTPTIFDFILRFFAEFQRGFKFVLR